VLLAVAALGMAACQRAPRYGDTVLGMSLGELQGLRPDLQTIGWDEAALPVGLKILRGQRTGPAREERFVLFADRLIGIMVAFAPGVDLAAVQAEVSRANGLSAADAAEVGQGARQWRRGGGRISLWRAEADTAVKLRGGLRLPVSDGGVLLVIEQGE
jgi:hypothetical protein